MNVKLITAVAVVLQTTALAALAQQPDTSRPGNTTGTATDRSMQRSEKADMPMTTQTFVQKAAVANMAEVELGKLALQKSQDKEIRDFADRMVKDHTAATTKLKSAASEANATVPAMLDSEHRQVVQRMQSLDGAAFDAEFRKVMEKDHHKAVALFESASQSQQVAEPVRQFAKNTLPTLKEHREMADDLDGKKSDHMDSKTSDTSKRDDRPATLSEDR